MSSRNKQKPMTKNEKTACMVILGLIILVSSAIVHNGWQWQRENSYIVEFTSPNMDNLLLEIGNYEAGFKTFFIDIGPEPLTGRFIKTLLNYSRYQMRVTEDIVHSNGTLNIIEHLFLFDYASLMSNDGIGFIQLEQTNLTITCR